MSCFAGKNGVVKIGVADSEVAVAQITNYTINETADTVECSHMDQDGNFKEYAPGMKSWSGSIDLIWNGQDTVTGLEVGADAVAIDVYPEGDAGTGAIMSGAIIITSMDVSGSVDGNVSASLSFQGTGTLSRTAATA
jgi:predicted secreted protein